MMWWTKVKMVTGTVILVAALGAAGTGGGVMVPSGGQAPIEEALPPNGSQIAQQATPIQDTPKVQKSKNDDPIPAPAQQPVDIRLPAFLLAKRFAEDPKDGELLKLLKARHKEALAETKMRFELMAFGLRLEIPQISHSGVRLLQAGLELCGNQEEKIALLIDYVSMTKEIESINQDRVNNGIGSPTDLAQASYFRIDAEIQLYRAKKQLEIAEKK